MADGAKVIRLRYAATCVECGDPLDPGTRARWDAGQRTVACIDHLVDGSADRNGELDRGQAGASAQREYERLRARRERAIRARHPHVGGLLVALSEEPASTRAWGKGARGERRLGRMLDKTGAIVLHDRRIPGSRINIDHIAIAPSGIYVIDAKDYKGRVRLRRSKLFGSEPDQLVVDGRDRSRLIASAQFQVYNVGQALRGCEAAVGIAHVPVLCFIGDNWGWFSRPFEVRGVTVSGPRRLVERVSQPGDAATAQLEAVAEWLADALPPA